MNSLVESIKEKVSRKREYNIYDTVVLIKDPLPKTNDFQNTIDELNSKVLKLQNLLEDHNIQYHDLQDDDHDQEHDSE